MEHSLGNIAVKKSVIYKKGAAIIIFIFFALIATLIVRHYFYVLDSYYYTAEFHFLFMKNNLKAGNIELFTDYFKSLNTVIKAFPMLLGSCLVQNYLLPFSKPILVAAVISALGLSKGIGLNFISLLIVGFISFGSGIFFFGDILPFLKKKILHFNVVISSSFFANGALGILFALPFVPVVFPATVSAIIRIPIIGLVRIMIMGFTIRLVLLVLMPQMFL
jgi:hypothetical protein